MPYGVMISAQGVGHLLRVRDCVKDKKLLGHIAYQGRSPVFKVKFTLPPSSNCVRALIHECTSGSYGVV